MIEFGHRGSFSRLETFLLKMRKGDIYAKLEHYAQQGVNALIDSTPKDSGITAASWGYEIVKTQGQLTITWTNTSSNKGVNIAIILQYGHGTGTGGYVQGRDYINPALRPVFDQIAEKVWKAVTSA